MSNRDTKHTPGPWELGLVSGAECAVQTTTYPKRTIAILDDGIVGHRNPENARLIAAAPDMLEALKSALEHFSEELPIHGIVKRAIEKAEGGN